MNPNNEDMKELTSEKGPVVVDGNHDFPNVNIDDTNNNENDENAELSTDNIVVTDIINDNKNVKNNPQMDDYSKNLLKALTELNKKKIDANGFVKIDLDELDYLLPDDLKSKGKARRYNHHIEKFTTFNDTYFPRDYDEEDSEYSFANMKNNRFDDLQKELYSEFFDGAGKLHDRFKQDFLNGNIVCSNINFSVNKKRKRKGQTKTHGEKVVDQRIQINFDKSQLKEKIEQLFAKYDVINDKEEKIYDVSLLIGGSTTQHPHADHSRTFVYEGKDGVGFEIRRHDYNASVANVYGISSIMIDLSKEKNGFYIGIPSSYVSEIIDDNNILNGNEKLPAKDDIASDPDDENDDKKLPAKEYNGNDADDNNLSVEYSNNVDENVDDNEVLDINVSVINCKQFVNVVFGNKTDKFEVISVDKFDSETTGYTYIVYNIKVEKGIRFVGDFMHCGTNNVRKLSPRDLQHFNLNYPNLRSLISIDKDKTVVSAFDKMTKEAYSIIDDMEYIPDICRFFCKTMEKQKDPNDTAFNVYTMPEDVCLYKNCPRSNLNHVLRKEESLHNYYTFHNNTIFAKKGFFELHFDTDSYTHIMSNIDKVNDLKQYEDYKNMINLRINFSSNTRNEMKNHPKSSRSETDLRNWQMKIILSKNTNKTINEIDWIAIKESRIKKNGELGVFGSRLFECNEIIGIYLGNIVGKKHNQRGMVKENSGYEYIISNNVTIDAEESIENEAFYMGMHMIQRSDATDPVNAKINAFGLVISTKIIEINDEICIGKK